MTLGMNIMPLGVTPPLHVSIFYHE